MDVPGNVKNSVERNKLLVYGIFIGLFLGWFFGGQGGQNTGWLMAAVVGCFIYYINKLQKKRGPTAIEVAEQIREEMLAFGLMLDSRPSNILLRKTGPREYIFDFKKQNFAYTWNGLLSGVQEIFDESAEVVESERYLRRVEMKDAVTKEEER